MRNNTSNFLFLIVISAEKKYISCIPTDNGALLCFYCSEGANQMLALEKAFLHF